MIDEAQINNWFTYHSPTPDQVPKYEAIRAHAREFAHVINNLVPDSADKSTALRTLRKAVMWANAAIATEQSAPPIVDPTPLASTSSPYQTSSGFTGPGGRHSTPSAAQGGTPTIDSVVDEFLTARRTSA